MKEKRSIRTDYSRRKKTCATSNERKRQRAEELNLLVDFLANRISAAGVSHVVKARTAWRRTLWLVIICGIACSMAVMSYRVLQEYLRYPTILRSKTVPVKELEFPAITICGLSPVPVMFAEEAGLHYMEEMRKILKRLQKFNISMEEQTRCLKDPLCYWSWFEDKCYCQRNPCATLYCYPDSNKSDDKCACSMLLCQWEGTSSACSLETDHKGVNWCICSQDFVYSLYNLKDFERPPPCDEEDKQRCDGPKPMTVPPDFAEALSALNASDQIKDLMIKIKTSMTKDLKDVERFFLPAVNVMDDYGLPRDSFILSCSYGLDDCTNLVTLYTPTYGKCYMFNYVGKEVRKKGQVRTTKNAGKQHGLQLFMHSRKKDFFPLLTRQLGVRLLVHDPRIIPQSFDEGIDIRPGDMASISIQLVRVQRLGEPWGKCAPNGVKRGNYSANPYKQNDCERQCVSMDIVKHCRCYHPRFLETTTIPRRGKVCQTNTSSFEDRCFRDTMARNDRGEIVCDCPAACREKEYDVKLSTSKLNDDFFSIVKTAKSLTLKNDSPAVTQYDFESSLMGVQIFYNALYEMHIDETAIYSWESLVANIGGNMGLFLGLSLVTLMEIVEFFADLAMKFTKKKRERASKVRTVSQPFY